MNQYCYFRTMIFITGATGLLGSRVLFDLVSAGHRVKAIKRSPARFACINHYFSGKHDLLNHVEWVEADITDIYSLEEALEGVSQVYHCAGKVTFQPGESNLLYNINVGGTANLVNLCLEKNIEKFCHVSSVAALGRPGDENYIDEDALWQTSKNNSSYAVSKYSAEREVWRGIGEGLNAVIVNPGIIIGPGNWKTDSSMLFRRVQKGLKYYTDGITGFVDVADVSACMLKLMESEIHSERFIVVSENVPFRKVMDEIADAIRVRRPYVHAGRLKSGFAWRMEKMLSMFSGHKPVITKETARSANNISFYSNDKIKKTTGIDFIPVVDSVKQTADIFLSQFN